MNCLWLLLLICCCGNRRNDCGCECSNNLCDNNWRNDYDWRNRFDNNDDSDSKCDVKCDNDCDCDDNRREPRIFPPYHGENCGCKD